MFNIISPHDIIYLMPYVRSVCVWMDGWSKGLVEVDTFRHNTQMALVLTMLVASRRCDVELAAACTTYNYCMSHS